MCVVKLIDQQVLPTILEFQISFVTLKKCLKIKTDHSTCQQPKVIDINFVNF